MAVKPIPEGFHSVTPYLVCKGAAAALEFYEKAFGAKELVRMEAPGGQIAHAEIKIGDSPIMLADESAETYARSPRTIGGTAVFVLVYVEDCDAMFHRAIGMGATQLQPLTDQFYGDRSGTILDPFGHMWTIATHTEDVSPEEMERRMAAMRPKAPEGGR